MSASLWKRPPVCTKPGPDGKTHAFRDRGRAPIGASHPKCERPRVRECVRCRTKVLARCRSSRRRVCVACSESYRRRVRRVAQSGFAVVGRDEVAFLTITAPGSDEHADRYHGGICPCTPPGGVPMGLWNAKLPKRWNRFAQALRRLHHTKLSYFRGIETQQRGALHEHVILASPDPSRPLIMNANRIRELAMSFGYGHAIRLDVVTSGAGAASYVSKYVSKACDDRPDVPWIDLDTGEFMRARYRPWSSSRDWGLRMKEILEQQCAWARAQEASASSLDTNTRSYTAAEADESDLIHRAFSVLASAGLIEGAG